MINEQDDYKRRYDLSAKLLEMGKLLLDEGVQNGQYAVGKTGTFLILLGGVILDDDDVTKFEFLCSMFSAKKLMDNMDNMDSPFPNFNTNEEGFEDLLSKIKRLREDSEETPEE